MMSKSKYSLCYPGDIYAQLFKRQTHFSVAAFQIRFYKLKYRTTFSEVTQNRLCTRNRQNDQYECIIFVTDQFHHNIFKPDKVKDTLWSSHLKFIREKRTTSRFFSSLSYSVIATKLATFLVLLLMMPSFRIIHPKNLRFCKHL